MCMTGSLSVCRSACMCVSVSRERWVIVRRPAYAAEAAVPVTTISQRLSLVIQSEINTRPQSVAIGYWLWIQMASNQWIISAPFMVYAGEF